MPNPFDWDYLTTPPVSDDVLDAFTVLYFAVFVVGFVLAAYLYYRPRTQPFGRLLKRRAVVKVTGIAMWVFGAGLFFFLIRLLQIDPFTFGRPIWMWLSVLALLGLVAWIAVSWPSFKRIPADDAIVHSQHTRRGVPQANTARRPVRRKSSLR